MTEEKLCGGKTFKEVMKEEVILSRVNFCTSCNLEKENAELKAQIEKMYTEEQVRECIDGACLDGQSGYDPSDLLINDYI